MQCLDFTEAGCGLLVKRSAHQREQQCVPADTGDVFGIMTGKEFFEDEGRVVCYPLVHWEDQVLASSCHPINVVPARPHALPTITLAEAPSRHPKRDELIL